MPDIYSKLLEIQAEGIEGVTKDSKNPHFKNTYISLGKLMDAVLPVLSERGIVLIQAPTSIFGAPGLTTTLRDVESDTEVSAEVPLMLEKDNPQGLGSAITYLRRYALMSILGLVADEDDDGEKASPRKREVVNEGTSSGHRDDRPVVF